LFPSYKKNSVSFFFSYREQVTPTPTPIPTPTPTTTLTPTPTSSKAPATPTSKPYIETSIPTPTATTAPIFIYIRPPGHTFNEPQESPEVNLFSVFDNDEEDQFLHQIKYKIVHKENINLDNLLQEWNNEQTHVQVHSDRPFSNTPLVLSPDARSLIFNSTDTDIDIQPSASNTIISLPQPDLNDISPHSNMTYYVPADMALQYRLTIDTDQLPLDIYNLNKLIGYVPVTINREVAGTIPEFISRAFSGAAFDIHGAALRAWGEQLKLAFESETKQPLQGYQLQLTASNQQLQLNTEKPAHGLFQYTEKQQKLIQEYIQNQYGLSWSPKQMREISDMYLSQLAMQWSQEYFDNSISNPSNQTAVTGNNTISEQSSRDQPNSIMSVAQYLDNLRYAHNVDINDYESYLHDMIDFLSMDTSKDHLLQNLQQDMQIGIAILGEQPYYMLSHLAMQSGFINPQHFEILVKLSDVLPKEAGLYNINYTIEDSIFQLKSLLSKHFHQMMKFGEWRDASNRFRSASDAYRKAADSYSIFASPEKSQESLTEMGKQTRIMNRLQSTLSHLRKRLAELHSQFKSVLTSPYSDLDDTKLYFSLSNIGRLYQQPHEPGEEDILAARQDVIYQLLDRQAVLKTQRAQHESGAKFAWERFVPQILVESAARTSAKLTSPENVQVINLNELNVDIVNNIRDQLRTVNSRLFVIKSMGLYVYHTVIWDSKTNQIYQNTPNENVEISSWESWANRYFPNPDWLGAVYEPIDLKPGWEKRIKIAKKEWTYDGEYRNCEHFVNYVISNLKYSESIRRAPKPMSLDVLFWQNE